MRFQLSSLARNKIVICLSSLFLGLCLVLAIGKVTSTRMSDVVSAFEKVDTVSLCCIFCLSFTNQALAAYKWQFVLRVLEDEKYSFTRLFFCVLLGSFLGQFLPQQIVSTGVRSVGVESQSGKVVSSKNVYSVIFDQLFDAVGSLVVFAFALLVAFQWVDLVEGFCLSIVAYWGVCLWLARNQKWLVQIYLWFGRALQTLCRAVRSDCCVQKQSKWQKSEEFVMPFRSMLQLLLINFVRYVVLAVRLWLVALTVGFLLSPSEAFLFLAVVPLSLAISITPGAFGVMELSFVAVTVAYGLSGTGALQTMFLLRGVTLASLSMALVIAGTVLVAKR